jgi:N-terminal domain on NACHT_NTPase and P-loop NTPases
MAEALAAVGIVSNIIQLVDFGTKVLHRLNDFQSSLGEIPKSFRHVKAELPILLDTLENTKFAVGNGSISEKTRHALLPVINGCREQIGLLNDMIGRVMPLESDSWRKKTTKAFSSLRQDAKVAKITAVLKGHIQALTYYHAAASSTLRPVKGIPLHARNRVEKMDSSN